MSSALTVRERLVVLIKDITKLTMRRIGGNGSLLFFPFLPGLLLLPPPMVVWVTLIRDRGGGGGGGGGGERNELHSNTKILFTRKQQHDNNIEYCNRCR